MRSSTVHNESTKQYLPCRKRYVPETFDAWWYGRAWRYQYMSVGVTSQKPFMLTMFWAWRRVVWLIFANSCTLKTEETVSSEKLVSICQNIRCHITEDNFELRLNIQVWTRDSSVGIATSCTAGVRFPTRARDFFFRSGQTVWIPPSLSRKIQWPHGELNPRPSGL
jgi:hypothetical protein